MTGVRIEKAAPQDLADVKQSVEFTPACPASALVMRANLTRQAG